MVRSTAGSLPRSPLSLHGTVPMPSFNTVLSQLAAVHTQEISELNKEHTKQCGILRAEIQVLRDHLQHSKAPVSDEGCMYHGALEPKQIHMEDIVPGDGFGIKEVWNKKPAGSWGTDIEDFLQSYKKRKAQSLLLHAEEADIHTEGRTCHTVICPNGNFRLGWDLCGLGLITFDLFTLPFILAFQPDPTLFTEIMDWFNLLFWTGDMIQGFFLGYYKQGEYISDHKLILYHYLKTWFVIDALVVFPEWMMLLTSSLFGGGDGEHVNKFMKVLKGARAVRVLRLLKLQRIMNLLYDMIESEMTFIVLTLARLLAFVLVLNHVIACAWFFIGRLALERDMHNWLETGNVVGKELVYMYTTSLHWSLTQFTPASMDISARNTWERVFSIIVLFFAMVTFSSIVASITGSMTSLRNMKADDMKQFWLLRRYLRQRNVSNDLSNRIFKFLEHHLKIQCALVQAPNVKILQGLSEALRNEMNHQMHSPHIMGHPFFSYLNSFMKSIMHRICRYSLSTQVYAEMEYVFNWGDEGKMMYFIKGGALEYKTMNGTKLSPSPQAKDWMSEGVLWTHWRHQGDLLAVSTSDIIKLNPESFVGEMGGHPRSWFFAKKYGMKFIQYLNAIDRTSLMDIIRDPEFYQKATQSSEAQDESQEEEEEDEAEGGAARSGAVESVQARTSLTSGWRLSGLSWRVHPGASTILPDEDRGIHALLRRCRRSFGF